MHVVVDVPIVPIRPYNDLNLCHYHSVPFLLGYQLVRVRWTDLLLAVNKGKSQFMAIFHSQLKGCLRFGKTVLCRYLGVIRSGVAQCCLLAVFAEAIFNASWHSLRVTLFWKGWMQQASWFLHLTKFCTSNLSFLSPKKIVDHFANHSSQILEALLHFDYVDYNALVEGGRSLRTCIHGTRCRRGYLAWSEDRSSLHSHWRPWLSAWLGDNFWRACRVDVSRGG